MLPNEIHRKLESIVQGNVIKEQADTCSTIRNFLCTRYTTDTTVKKDFEGKQRIKKEQGQLLKNYAIETHQFFTSIPENWTYLTRGGESRVFLHDDQKHVVKLNEGIYYTTWLEYFNSLVIHNLLFPDTSYELLGLIELDNAIFAVLKQPFVISDETADLLAIREYLEFNGFSHLKRQDYFNEELGLILEDMHDENVIKKGKSLFFIDTVFYISR
ncbi:MAG: hypothetical protein MUE71_12790 [Chitinophagaceae bacterium]|nr:hypothetical protein [Chitinophagaceae bacterium]